MTAGLERLYLLRLDRTPAADKISGTVRVWAESVLRTLGPHADQKNDTIRLREGFERLVDTATNWPSPASLYAAMPSRAERRFQTRGGGMTFADLTAKQALQIEELTVEQKQMQAKKAMEMIRDILNGKEINDHKDICDGYQKNQTVC